MAEKSRRKIISTFAARADCYDRESKWVRDPALLSPLVPPPFGGAWLLDACCGTGAVSRYAIQSGWEVVACDISRAMLSKCEAPFRIVADTSALPFRNRAFDTVIVRQGLQYLDLYTALNGFKRVSRFDIHLGHITVENATDAPWWRQYFEIASPGRREVFIPGLVAEACESCGLHVVKQEVVYSRDCLKGPIEHLPGAEKERIIQMWASSPQWFITNYQVRELSNGDFEYSHRWEFITAQIPPD